MAIRRLSVSVGAILLIGVFCLLLSASGAAAFGLPQGASARYCFFEGMHYDDTIPPFRMGNTTAIHIGNTKSCIAGYGGREDPDTSYQFCIPSWVAFTDDGTLFGEAALNHAAVSPGTAISGFKRVIGLSLQDELVKRETELVPYKFVNELGRCGIQIETEGGNTEDIVAEGVAGILMSKLKHMAEAHLGREIMYAVVTVPGHFKDDQRRFMAGAARFHGGFAGAKAVDEQVAAAAAYGLHEKMSDGKVILVFHIGGRTTYATKFKFQDGMARLLDARHDAYLGGDDFTGRVVDHFVELIQEKHHLDIRRDGSALRKLRAECESAKKALSDREDTLVNVESLLDGVDFSEALTRAKLEELNRDLLARAMDMVEQVVSRKDAIDEIILVGGSVRIPKVGQLLRDYFHGREREPIMEEEAVIRGAALLSRPESAIYVSECDHFYHHHMSSSVAITETELKSEGFMETGAQLDPWFPSFLLILLFFVFTF